ncbi:MAG: DUF4956 domain-containing protein [Erysipelotrichaceae bacterium]|nr:DUF4956 domain-containing protein [Erysipelotrichaceae bacterium]
MDSLFNLLTNLDQYLVTLIVIMCSFVIGLVYTVIISFKLRATRSFFVTSILMPMIVSSVIAMVSLFLDSSTTGAVRIATIAVALGLIRFRSVNGRAEEMLILFGGVAFGLITGLGYVVIASIVALSLAILYVILSNVNLFNFKREGEEKLLKVTIPEDLNYNEAFDAILKTYLKSYELVEIKTTGMGSLFRLSYKVELLAKDSEKLLIDELRIKNSNLEISLLPYVESTKAL